MKIAAGITLVLGLLVLLFAGFAFVELRNAARAQTGPNPDEMMFTKIVCPEFFDPSGPQTKDPATLAGIALGRIYSIGGSALMLLAVGAILMLLGSSNKRSREQLPGSA